MFASFMSSLHGVNQARKSLVQFYSSCNPELLHDFGLVDLDLWDNSTTPSIYQRVHLNHNIWLVIQLTSSLLMRGFFAFTACVRVAPKYDKNHNEKETRLSQGIGRSQVLRYKAKGSE